MRTYIQYVRKPDRNPIGVVAAIVDGDRADIGWSYCCPLDKFDKKKARTIAVGRAKKRKCGAFIPDCMKEAIAVFAEKLLHGVLLSIVYPFEMTYSDECNFLYDSETHMFEEVEK